MHYRPTYAPIRTTSRTVTRRRARRALYTLLGIAFVLGCASSLTPMDDFGQSSILASSQTDQQSFPETVASAALSAPTSEPAASAELHPQPVLLHTDQSQMAQTAPQAQQELIPAAIELKIEEGESLASLLIESGISQEQATLAQQALGEIFDVRKLRSGQRVAIEIETSADASNMRLSSLSLPVSLTTSIEVSRLADAQFKAKKIEKPLERKLAFAGGKIRSSLYQTAGDIGLPRGMVGEIINAFSYDVDFQRDIKSGDTIEVLYERMENYEGKHAGTGDLIFAELNLGGETVKIYRYEDKSGFADFYNEAGESVRKALLRTPISGARITSGYGMRSHPILGYNRMHRGVDFAAPIGTPIFAAGDGRVEFIGRKGGYGNYLKIAHNDRYATAYAHLSRFAGGISPGKRVRQGQIVAYVGNTGSSTGPHLHYEVHVNGDQVNPSGVKFKTGNVLKGKELAAFKRSMEKIEAKLDAVKKGASDIAMADFEREVYSN